MHIPDGFLDTKTVVVTAAASILFGPYSASLILSAVLIVQCLFSRTGALLRWALTF